MNSAHSMKKTPAVVKAKTLSLKIPGSGHTLPPTLGGRRERMNKFASITRNSRMNPMIRVAQAKPMVSKRCWRRSGNMIPPTEPPVAARPLALPRETMKK